MSRRSLSARAWSRAIEALTLLGASAACNYDFDEYQGLAPPLRDSGSVDQGGAAGAGPSDAGSGAAGRSGSAGTSGSDAAKGDAAKGDAAGAAGTGQGGSAGSSGATDSGDAPGTDAAGGTGGTAGSSGSGGSAGAGGSDDSGATGGAGGSGGTPVDASGDGVEGGGAGGAGSGGTAGTGTGGAGTGGTTPPPDGGSRPDLRVVDSPTDAPFDCAAIGGQVYENHCYYAMTTPVTWAVAARQACVTPAHLVTITSPGEQTFVVSFFADQSRWIGYYRPTGAPQNPSAFQWITGESSTFRHWFASNGEPDYDGECVRLGPSNNWGDNPCTAAFPVICERE